MFRCLGMVSEEGAFLIFSCLPLTTLCLAVLFDGDASLFTVDSVRVPHIPVLACHVYANVACGGG